MTPTGVDVLVVGAGPAGLTLALQALEHGARVRVVERRVECSRHSPALIVHARTLEVLRPLGVTDTLLARGEVAPSVRLHLGRREIPLRLGAFAMDDTAFPHLLFEPQAVVEEVLREALGARGVEVEWGTELTSVVGDRGGPVATLRRAGAEELLSCRYVAGCDGADSTVRRLARVGWQGGPYHEEVVLADLELDGELAPRTAHAVAGRNGVLFLFSSSERATWRMLATRPAGGDDRPPGQPLGPVPTDDLQALLDGAGLAVRVAAVPWSGRARLEHRIASHYRRGPLFLVGDAAHVHSPAGGQGMNTGIQDAANLGWKLAFAASGAAVGPFAEDRLLDSYEAERRPVARRVLALTHALFWAEAGTDPLASFVRGALVPLGAPAVPFLLRRRRLLAGGVRVLSQLGLHYRRSVLSVEGVPTGRHGPCPGDRLPDTLVTVAGRSWKLHELLARPGVHVLLEQEAVWPDQEELLQLVSVYRVVNWPGRGALVVRPDGYVGLRSATGDTSEIMRWLATVGRARGRDPQWNMAVSGVS